MAEIPGDGKSKVNAPSPTPAMPGAMSGESYSPGIAFIEASGLLVIWSLLVINEGALRFNALAIEGGGYPNLGSGSPAAGFSFFASLFEVIFGFIGLFLGLSGFIFHYYSTFVTKSAMIVQSILGWYVFIIYVFVRPAIRARDLIGIKAIGATPGEFRFLVTMGILTSFHFCLALQGGQFLFMARTIVAATSSDFMKQRSGNKMRAVFWSGNLALAGLWTLIIGAFINARIGSGKLEVVYMFPPHVGRIPGLTVYTGLIMLLYGVWGMSIPFMSFPARSAYFLTGVVVFLFTWLNFTIVQLGVVGNAALGVAMHAGLVFMVMFLGPYFNWCCCRPEYDAESKSIEDEA